MLLILFLSVGLTKAISQQKDTSNYNLLCCRVVETRAEFPGGEEVCKKFIEQGVKDCIEEVCAVPNGSYLVEVWFKLDKNGIITNVTSISQTQYGLEEELCNMLKQSPPWKPATRNGRVVSDY